MANNYVEGSTPQKESYTYEWYVVFFCMIAYVFSFVDRQILALMIEPVKADLQLSDTQFSLLVGLAFSLFYAVMGLPIAYLSDRFSRPLIISIGIAFWSLATAACGLSKNFLQLFLARMGVGIGEASLTPATYSMLSDMFPKEKLGRAIGVYSLGAFLGSGIAFMVGGSVIHLLRDVPSLDLGWFGEIRSWQLAFIIVGLPGLLVSLVILLGVRDPQRKDLRSISGQPSKKAGWNDCFRFIGAHKMTLTCLYLGFAFFSMAQYATLSWTPALYIRRFGLSSIETGYILGAVLLVASTSGVYAGGWLVDHLQRRGRQDAGMMAGVIGIACLVVPGVIYPLVDQLWLSIVLMIPAMFFASFPLATSAAAMQVLAPNQVRAQISALFLLIGNLIGLGVGTTLVALITDRYYQTPLAVGSSMAIVIAVASVICFCLLLPGCRHFRQSLAREAERQKQ